MSESHGCIYAACIYAACIYAVDLHYWQTNNLEWYDLAAITTKDGALEIILSRKNTHDLNFQGGMLSTWNKFCFTGGILEASVSLPGTNDIVYVTKTEII